MLVVSSGSAPSQGCLKAVPGQTGSRGRTPEQPADVPERGSVTCRATGPSGDDIRGGIRGGRRGRGRRTESRRPHQSGTDAAHGGRYGEPASEGLWAALETLGAEFRESDRGGGAARFSDEVRRRRAGCRTRAGRRRRAGSTMVLGATIGLRVRRAPRRRARIRTAVEREKPRRPRRTRRPAVRSLGELAARETVARAAPPVGPEAGPDCWPADYPPAPHWQADLRVDRMVMVTGIGAQGEPARLPAALP